MKNNKIIKHAYELIDKFFNLLLALLSSRGFFVFVLVQFALQSLWVAFSFRFPMIYDESFHFPVIKVFSHQLSPFIFNQPTSYDVYHNLSNGDATIFHYLMSLPYRVVASITNNQMAQVITMRIICIVLVIIGLYLFYLLFRKLKISRSIISVSLLVFSLIPIVPLISATINYDNLLFPIVALYLLICVKIIQNKNVYWIDYAQLVIVGSFASLTKYTFLPIFAASLVYLAIVIYRRHKNRIFSKLWWSFRQSNLHIQIVFIILLLMMVGLFSIKYVRNEIIYHTPQPSCAQTLGESRCMTGLIANNAKIKSQNSHTSYISFLDYVGVWFNKMFKISAHSANSIESGGVVFKSSLKSMFNFLFVGTIFCASLIILAWKHTYKKFEWCFLYYIALVIILSAFLNNLATYYEMHVAVAIQPRYILTAIPLLLVGGVTSFSYLLGKKSKLKIISLFVLLLLFTQGGGVITHILRSDDSWYWQNSKIIEANHIAKRVLQPIVKEW